ncbi:MAG TPA: hypothetical protein VH476_03680 [Solirubrobacterales bacterium]
MARGRAVITDALTTPVEEERTAARGQHLRWSGCDSGHGFCGEALGAGPFITLVGSAQHMVCPTCLSILDLYYRTGIWEGHGDVPGRR